jgi:hypothetical protein
MMGLFSSSHGLRQGSFCLLLSGMISAMVNGDLFSGFSVGCRNGCVVNISHLLAGCLVPQVPFPRTLIYSLQQSGFSFRLYGLFWHLCPLEPEFF